MNLRSLTLLTFGVALVSSPLSAAEPFYLGKWAIDGAVVAPWAGVKLPDEKERARLLGKTLAFNAKAIAGPQPFVCKGPHYAIKDYPADMLFQGAFGEMRSKDKSVDPGKLAAALGFKGTNFKTLETSPKSASTIMCIR